MPESENLNLSIRDILQTSETNTGTGGSHKDLLASQNEQLAERRLDVLDRRTYISPYDKLFRLNSSASKNAGRENSDPHVYLNIEAVNGRTVAICNTKGTFHLFTGTPA